MRRLLKHLPRAVAVSGLGAVWAFNSSSTFAEPLGSSANHEGEGGENAIVNWSGTHVCTPERVHYPESLVEVEHIVAEAHRSGRKLRPVGTALSPNGIAFNGDGNELINLSMMDNVVRVDTKQKQVTVQAGASVAALVEHLRPYKLTLPNYASIQEQQIGGLIQVGAHGTGAKIPPLDDCVVGITLVTPEHGTLSLSETSHPELFRFAKCGLGSFGVVTEVTLQCTDAHRLLEMTRVVNVSEITPAFHRALLQSFQHVRYMWLPYCDKVVIVGSLPVSETELQHLSANGMSTSDQIQRALVEKNSLPHLTPAPPAVALRPLQDLYVKAAREIKGQIISRKDIEQCNFAELRDRLIDLDPLNVSHIIAINQAECSYWNAVQGYRLDWSDRILGFECGGQQWVSEVRSSLVVGKFGSSFHFNVRSPSQLAHMLILTWRTSAS